MQGGYNQNRKQRYNPGGGNGGGHHHHSGGNRPRKNYPAAREKYLAQARDALASGDRVLAENYFQHADHCYRMMMEEGYRPRHNNQPQHDDGAQQGQGQEQETAQPASNGGALPAFITNYEGEQKQAQVPVQNWEERDEA
jgi:hypothetical protein